MAMTQHYTLGIDMGASSVKVVALRTGAAAVEGAGAGGAPAVLWSTRRPHYGDPVACLRDLLAGMPAALAPEGCGGIAATGSGAGALAEAGAALPVLEDVPAIASGAQILAPEARSVIEIGGQNAYFVCRLAAAVPEFAMNESCASGTGSFFEDQMTRLGLRIEDFSALVGRAEGHEVPRISGRCAVFAKTDIIHRQQEGVPVEDILLGLCYAMVKSYKALIVRGLPVEAPVALSGGVLLNAGVVRAVREVFKLGEDGLIAREGNLFFQAAGAALHASKLAAAGGGAATLDALRGVLDHPRFQASELPRLAPLPDGGCRPGEGFAVLSREDWERDPLTGRIPVFLGIDVGSTSTDLSSSTPVAACSMPSTCALAATRAVPCARGWQRWPPAWVPRCRSAPWPRRAPAAASSASSWAPTPWWTRSPARLPARHMPTRRSTPSSRSADRIPSSSRSPAGRSPTFR